MAFLDVRRLAAADMWGTAGAQWRRKVIRAEFVLGALLCTGLGVIALISSTGWWIVVGVWLLCAGINYVPLAIHAGSLSRPGALEAELSGLDLRRELRRAGIAQLWIAVPLAVAIAALTEQRNARTR